MRTPRLRGNVLVDTYHFLITIEVSIVVIIQIVPRVQSLFPPLCQSVNPLDLICENVSLISVETIVKVQL